MAGLARVLGMSLIALGMAACGGDAQRDAGNDTFTGDQLDIAGLIGIKKNPPDEFAVSTAKPLQLPEDFAALPAPTPGTRSALLPDPIADSRAALWGETEPTPTTTAISASESALLASTGNPNPDPNIRAVLETEEAEREAERPTYALSKIFPSIDSKYDAREALQPEQERVRLSEILPKQEVGSTDVATIPTSQAPAGTTPSTARTTVDPNTGGELIFIPE